MRNLHELDRYRVDGRKRFGWSGDHACGAFVVPSPIDGAPMSVIATDGTGSGWQHVSVSRRNRTPNWQEMEHVIQLFGLPDEVWMQLHVPAADHINIHPYTLHWWMPTHTPIPLPPKEFV